MPGDHSVTHDTPASDAVEQLRHSSVHVAPGAERVVDDVDHTRRIIGNRPIVVAIVPRVRDFNCDDLTAELPGLIVLQISLTYSGSCGDEDTVADMRLPQLTGNAYAEEAVWQFDAHTTDPKAAQRVLAQPEAEAPVHVLIIKTFLFIALGWFGAEALYVGVLRRRFWARYFRSRRAAVNARLNRLADTMLRSDSAATAAERAELGRRYVLLLRDFERVETRLELSVVDRDLAAFEAEHGLARPKARRR